MGSYNGRQLILQSLSACLFVINFSTVAVYISLFDMNECITFFKMRVWRTKSMVFPKGIVCMMAALWQG